MCLFMPIPAEVSPGTSLGDCRYQIAQPMVFCGLFPIDADRYEDLREALGKLQLNDAALAFEPEVRHAMCAMQRRTHHKLRMSITCTCHGVCFSCCKLVQRCAVLNM